MKLRSTTHRKLKVVKPTDTHPAKFTPEILDAAVDVLHKCWPWEWASHPLVLDPFAGTGRIHELRQRGFDTVGVELEPEFAAWHPATLVGDATALPVRWAGRFDAIVTSPCYANRMADRDMRDSVAGTYMKSLRREASPGSSCHMQWGQPYRDLHTRAWREAWWALQPGGSLVINIKDHYRGYEQQSVAQWHFDTIRSIGFLRGPRRRVAATGLTRGENDHRMEYEHVAAFIKPIAA